MVNYIRVIVLLFFLIFLFLLFSLVFTKRLNGGLDFIGYKIQKSYYVPEIKRLTNTEIDIELPKFEIKDSDKKKIPKIIHQTHKTRELIPNYYIDNLKKMNKEWDYKFQDNEEARKFLLDNYGQKFVDKFDSFKSGPHKSDLWRLCVLYKYGGCYIDADLEMEISFDDLIKICQEDLIIPCSRMINSKERLFNALIICKPLNPKIGECIKKIMSVDNKTLTDFYHFNLELMQEILKDDLNYKIYEEYLPKFKINISIDPKDCYIVTGNKKVIAKSKRSDYI